MHKNKFLKYLGSIALLAVLTVSQTAWAQSSISAGGGSSVSAGSSGSSVSSSLENPLNVSSIQALVNNIVDYVITIGTYFLVFMLIYTGFKFIVARGNEEKLTNARTALMWTVVGGLLLIGAKALAVAIEGIANALTT